MLSTKAEEDVMETVASIASLDEIVYAVIP